MTVKKTSPARWLFYFLVFVGAVLMVVFAWYQKKDAASPQVRDRNIYDTEVPSANAVIDFRLILPTPYQLAQVPQIDYLTAPMGSDNGSFTYDAQTFGAWNAKRGGQHRGQDWNGIGGMNTDLGDPVYAVGRGKVMYAGQPVSTWGNVVVLMHKFPDGRYIQSLYAHLNTINVVVGQTVARGARIGTVGTANGNYPAHLHFEMIESIFNEAGMPAYGNLGNRLDPTPLLQQYAPPEGAKLPDLMPALERIELQMNRPFIQMNVGAGE